MIKQKSDKLLVVLTLIALIFIFVGCQKKEDKPKITENTIKKEEIVSTDGFEAKLYFDGDHYVLSVFTNIIEKDFSFTNDNSKFLLDDIGVMFENASFIENEKDKTRTCTIKLDNNSLYVFNFIKLGKDEMKFGNNIKIN